jgi:predicted aspartyl protease
MLRYETAAGKTMEAPVYKAVIRVAGVEAVAHINPSEEDDAQEGAAASEASGESDVDAEFGLSSSSDDAVLGSAALASLRLLVDCRHHRLIPYQNQKLPSINFSGSGLHAPVEIPGNATGSIVVDALVDTGCTDMDLSQRLIHKLGLAVDPSEGTAQFETAGGVTIEAPIYRALVRVLGREASVRISPSEDDACQSDDGTCSSDDSDGGNTDAALLGHDALAALGLLVDCHGRRLLAAPL